MFDPKLATPADAKRTMTDLMKLRTEVGAEWMAASESLRGWASTNWT